MCWGGKPDDLTDCTCGHGKDDECVVHGQFTLADALARIARDKDRDTRFSPSSMKYAELRGR